MGGAVNTVGKSRAWERGVGRTGRKGRLLWVDVTMASRCVAWLESVFGGQGYRGGEEGRQLEGISSDAAAYEMKRLSE